MMSDPEMRIYALETAIRTEGSKAVTEEVLEAARRIYEFLVDAEAAPATVN
jgi:hypothetical protein